MAATSDTPARLSLVTRHLDRYGFPPRDRPERRGRFILWNGECGALANGRRPRCEDVSLDVLHPRTASRRDARRHAALWPRVKERIPLAPREESLARIQRPARMSV